MTAVGTMERDRVRRSQVRRMLDRAFGSEEQEVVRTQAFDLAPGGGREPDRAYWLIANAALGRSRCERILDGPDLDAVEAYWTARGIAHERQQQFADQKEDGVPEGRMTFRGLTSGEKSLWRAKDMACLRLQTVVMPTLAGERRRAPDADLVLDLVREWAGIMDRSMRTRMAAAYKRSDRSCRPLKAGRKQPRQTGVHPLLDTYHDRAMDRLASVLSPEDLVS